MRITLSALFLFLMLPAGWAQVIATHPFDTEISRAVALEAGATATDVPHHVHYDLKLYNHKGKLTTGTWDIWRDPQHYIRTDIVAGDYHYTHIEDLNHKKQWRHFNTVMPLKVYDLRQAYREPDFLVEQFSKATPKRYVRFQQVDGAPFDCTNTLMEMHTMDLRICFDPLAHVLAFAQMLNQTVTWEDWQPLGTHSVPKRFRIYDAGRVMVEAAGTAEQVKTFPPGLFAIPADQPDMGAPEDDGAAPHKWLGAKPVHLEMLYGNVLVQVHVGVDGKVKKTTLIDADDDDIIPEAKQFTHHLTFEPQITNGMPTPFDQYIYLRCAIGVQQKSPVRDQ
ncbi:MAG: hypothetical protein WAM68_05145 [Acidobacteriaceae bacterium]